MNELIRIELRPLGEGEVQTVNARDLHAFLEIGKVFRAWITERIEQYGFIAGQDYVLAEGLSRPNPDIAKARPQRVVEYHLTLEMAKELAMVERNAAGRQARAYFLECERRLRAVVPTFDPRDPKQLAAVALQLIEVNQELKDTIAEQAPKVAAHARLFESEGTRNITETAKYLQMSPSKLFDWLHRNDWIYRRAGGNGCWLAKQHRIDSGLMTHKVTTIMRDNGDPPIHQWQALITTRGVAKIAEQLGAQATLQ